MLLLALVSSKPAKEQLLLIDAAPSVVAYQGSSQTHTRFVIAPMGRSLGYLQPTNVNQTFHTQKNGSYERTGPELLQINPVYVHH
ncbi:CG13038 [Drosophila busckii]|uniref:CG13038 n=1 Tax=Drosophila busckii TaxID=30019 RepID=A0A0M5J3T1_DROBS|nr:CG13038 [Drosophila busckii]